MYYDLISLMQFLSSNTFPTLNDIIAGTNATKRQTLYRLEKLNKLLKSEHAPILIFGTSPQKNIRIPEESKEAILRLLANADTSAADYYTREERLLYMYLLIFIHNGYLSLTHFTDALKCSRSTILLDFKELKQLLKNENIEICNNRQKGYYFSGPETRIRRFMIEFVVNALSDSQGRRTLDRFIEDWGISLFSDSRKIITRLTKKHSIRLIEARLTEFIYIFIFLKERMQNGISAELYSFSNTEADAIPTLREYAFAVDLIREYSDTDRISETDIMYIASWIVGISYGSIHEDTMDRPFISSIVQNIMLRFETISGIHLHHKDQIFEQLYAHMRPAYYRLLFRLPIFNPICKTVKDEYSSLYQLMDETMKPFSILFQSDIPEDEIAYLTMHFAAAAKEVTEVQPERKKALIICPNGVASSVILYNELLRLFPEIQFLPPQDSAVLEEDNLDADLIFTTFNTTLPDSLALPVIRMNPVMSAAEKNRIIRQVYRFLRKNPQSQYDIEAVMNIIAKYADVHNESILRSELHSYFCNSDGALQESVPESGLHLTDLVRPEIIRLQFPAADREEAIRMTYAPMVEHCCVLPDYVDDIVRTAGQYLVITKHVALPHTKPEAGALTCALGIGVLKEPVVFGNAENDPVKYIFALSAVNNSSHLPAMAELVRLLNDRDFFSLLDNATNPMEIVAYIRAHI